MNPNQNTQKLYLQADDKRCNLPKHLLYFRSLEEELPSLESVSSENSQESDKSDDLYRIRKLETIIAELTPSDTTNEATTTVKALPRATCATTETQTMSTGDIIMTSVYSE